MESRQSLLTRFNQISSIGAELSYIQFSHKRPETSQLFTYRSFPDLAVLRLKLFLEQTVLSVNSGPIVAACILTVSTLLSATRSIVAQALE